MKKIEFLLDEYAISHQTKLNKLIHYICVPAIFFSLIGLLASIPTPEFFYVFSPNIFLPYAHFGMVVIGLGLLYYLRMSFSLFIGMLLFSLLVVTGINWIHQINAVPL